jgi:hypothetical protein
MQNMRNMRNIGAIVAVAGLFALRLRPRRRGLLVARLKVRSKVARRQDHLAQQLEVWWEVLPAA